MRDALVAVDAGLFPAQQVRRVLVLRAHALPREVHVLVVVTVATLERIVRLEARPLVLRELEALVDELLPRVDRPEDLAPYFLRRLHLARDLGGPVVRNVAVRALGPHARAVGEVNRALELRVDVVAHLVAAGAEDLGIRELERRVERAPEDDAGDERADDE